MIKHKCTAWVHTLSRAMCASGTRTHACTHARTRVHARTHTHARTRAHAYTSAQPHKPTCAYARTRARTATAACSGTLSRAAAQTQRPLTTAAAASFSASTAPATAGRRGAFCARPSPLTNVCTCHHRCGPWPPNAASCTWCRGDARVRRALRPHITQPPHPTCSVPDECPQGVVALINRCLDLDPERRPSASQLIAELEALAAACRDTKRDQRAVDLSATA